MIEDGADSTIVVFISRLFCQDARYPLFRCINKIVVDIYVQYFRLEKIERIVYSILIKKK